MGVVAVGVAELRHGVHVAWGLGIHPGSLCPGAIFCRKDVSTRSTCVRVRVDFGQALQFAPG